MVVTLQPVFMLKCLQCSEIITSALISCVNFTLCMLFVGKMNHLFKKLHIFFLGERLGLICHGTGQLFWPIWNQSLQSV
jgi:hypothetical protein